MLTSISFNLINRVKYQLCQSQKWQYHLCGDELCARLFPTFLNKLLGSIESKFLTWKRKRMLLGKNICMILRAGLRSAIEKKIEELSANRQRTSETLKINKNQMISTYVIAFSWVYILKLWCNFRVNAILYVFLSVNFSICNIYYFSLLWGMNTIEISITTHEITWWKTLVHPQNIYLDSKILAPVACFSKLVETNLLAIWSEQQATYTRFNRSNTYTKAKE